jgi:hypothetical protein
MQKRFGFKIRLTLATGCFGILMGSPASTEIMFAADGGQGNASQLYELNPATGAVVATVGPIGFAVTGLAVHPQTHVIYASTSNADANFPGQLISIDWRTGAGTRIGLLTDGTQTAADLAFASDGTLYGWLSRGKQLATIDLVSGTATAVGPSGLNTFGSGLAISAIGTLYLTGGGDGGSLTLIDTATGSPVSTVPLIGGSGLSEPINALAFSQSGALFGSRGTSCSPCETADLLTINTTTGNITRIGPSVNKLDAIVFHPLVRIDVALLEPRGTEVKVGRRSPLTIVILGSDTFDVQDVDGSTIEFGPDSATVTHRRGPHLKDINDDGRPDLLMHFRTSDTGIVCGDFSATLQALTADGSPVTGSAPIVAGGRNC